MRRIRVVQLVQNMNYGGMERVIADLVRGLDPRQFESHVVVLQYLGRFADGLEDAAALHRVPPLGRFSMLRPSVLRDALRALAPDVVHSHSGVWYKGSLAARMARVPRVLHTEHGRKNPDPWSDRLVDRAASRRNDGVVAVSEALARHLRDEVRVRCPVHLIPNGIDTGRFRPGPVGGALRHELGIPSGVPVIGSIGRLEPIKGYDVMVRALASAPADAVLLIAGDGSERKSLEALATDLGVAARVRFLGWRDDTVDLLRTFSLFTMSSHSEGTSVSLLEAMSAGTPVVVTDVGGNGRVLGPGLAHRMVPAGDAVALGTAWARLLANPVALAEEGAAARLRVEDAFSMGPMVQQYAALYRGELIPWAG